MSEETENEVVLDPKVEALAQIEGVSADDIDDEGDNEYGIGKRSYLVLTDEEADERVKVYIEELLWAFNSGFIESETGINGLGDLLDAAKDRCEGLNDAISGIVESTCGIEKFASDAVDADGRGHFIAPYDFEERDVEVRGETFYIYRKN